MKKLYNFSLLDLIRKLVQSKANRTYRSIWSHPPFGPGLPTMARAQTEAYVARRCAACPGPPPNPPSGCCHVIILSITLHISSIPETTAKNPSTHRCLFPGSNPTCRTLNACTVQNINQGWLASWLMYLVGKPWIRFRTRNCMCAFFRRDGGVDVDAGSGICFINTASVSAWVLDVGVENPSIGVGRSSMMTIPRSPSSYEVMVRVQETKACWCKTEQ